MKNDIAIIRGTTNTIPLYVTDGNEEPYVLEDGEVMKFGVKKNPNFTEYAILKTVAAGGNGVYTVALSPEDTAELPFGKYFYDIGLQSGDGFYPVIACKNRRMQEFHILPNITKRGDEA